VVARPSNLARKTPDGIWFPQGLPANQINGYKTQLYVNDGGAPVVLTGIAVDLPTVVAQDAVNTTTIAAVQYSSATPRVAGATLYSLSNAAAALAATQDNLFTAQVQNPIINPGEAVYLQMTAAGTGTALPAGTHIRALF